MDGAAASNVPAAAIGPVVPRLAAFIDDSLSVDTLGAVFTARSLEPPQVSSGGSAAAMDELDASDPPDIVVVDTGDSRSPAADLGILRSLLPERVRMIALGSSRGVDEYRDVLAAGASDYLIKPISREDLDDAIFGHEPEASRRKLRAPASGGATERQFVFLGARGGVGATTVAVNVAWLMAELTKEPSVLLDLDLQFGTILLALNLEPSPALVQMLQEPDRVDDVMVRQSTQEVGRHLSVLAAEEPIDRPPAVQPSAPVVLMRQLRSLYRNVFIDFPADRLEGLAPYLAEATDVVLVSDVSLAGVRDTIRILSQMERAAPDARCHIVIGGVSDQRKAPMTTRQFEESVGTKVAAMIPHEPIPVGESSAAGRPLATFRKGSKVAKAYNEFVAGFLPPSNKPGWRIFGDRRKEAG